jgi:hypothetical protein
MSSMTNTTNWYDGFFISLFAQLAAHYVHITYEERHSTLSQRVNLPLLIHVTYPKETLVEGQYKAAPPGVTSVVTVLHEADHYAVLEIDILNKKVYVYDGLYRDLDRSKMIKTQGKDIVNKGVAPGAVVTVQCDYHVVSHSIQIVGIIYKVSKFGSARIATIAGILLSGCKKGPWWIPSDQYALRYGANKDANITPQLTEIRVAILAGTYNINNSAPKCTIQEAHQQSHKPLVHAGNLNVGVKGELAKQGIVAASRKASSVPARALATVRQLYGKS